jgi:putative transposase
MHCYLATICRDLGADFVRVGGVADHVHIVTTLPRTLSQAQLIEKIKKLSSKWIKHLTFAIADFSGNAGTAHFQ